MSTRRPLSAIERDARHLHEVEQIGESEWTPWIAILGLALFFALVIAVMTTLTVTVAHLAH
jgi:hypothetical protein